MRNFLFKAHITQMEILKIPIYLNIFLDHIPMFYLFFFYVDVWFFLSFYNYYYLIIN